MLIHTLPLPDSLGSCSTKHTNSSPTEEEEKKISQKISSKTYVTYKCSYPDTCRPVSLPCVYISLTCLSCTFCLFSFPPLVASLSRSLPRSQPPPSAWLCGCGSLRFQPRLAAGGTTRCPCWHHTFPWCIFLTFVRLRCIRTTFLHLTANSITASLRH